jgi:hypothetical protein
MRENTTLRWCWKCKRDTLHTQWSICVVCCPGTTHDNPRDLPLVVPSKRPIIKKEKINE